MGQSTSSSLLRDPNVYATPADENNLKPEWWKTYDYIIVGGGTAGCVLAARLSEDANTSVLLIEAGTKRGSDVLFSKIPLAFSKLSRSPYDWSYETVPQVALDGRKCHWPRGKVLGGSSSINALNYHRCSPEDFKTWVEHGATGWGPEDLKPYFTKAERYRPNPLHVNVDPSVHGSSGPTVSGHFEAAPIMETIIESCVNCGVNRAYDFNTDAGTLGVSHLMSSIDEYGTRSSAETGYITPEVLARPNLKIALATTVEKVIVSPGSGTDTKPRAVGVLLSTTREGPKYYAAAKKEVILTAGAIGSPQLLLLSGIGPSDELENVGVQPVHDLPYVGNGLQDHISSGSMIFRAKPGETWDHLTKPLSSLLALAQWFVSGKGAMSGKGTQIAAFLRSDNPNLPKDIFSGAEIKDVTSGPNSPDLELMYAPMIAVVDGPNTAGLHGITGVCILLRPSSTGSLTLASSNAYDYPVINPNYFVDQNDVNIMLRGMRLLLHVARTQPLSDYLDLGHDAKDPSSIFWPGDCKPDEVTDEELLGWLKKKAQTPWHPSGTAKIGISPSDSVVDAQLRVHGIEGLRVVDASVFPTQVSGHCCAVVIAMAERASDLITGKL